MPALRVGTRGSRLALAQADWVIARLRELAPDQKMRTEIIDSRPALTPDHPFLGDGIFVKEIQVALLEDRVDLAVHSLKDLPTAPVPGLRVAAIPQRADFREAMVGCALDDLVPGAVVGTSSPRRSAQLLNLRPDLHIKPINGNIGTRIAKVESGDYDAVLLAAAGLQRLGLGAAEIVAAGRLLPAPGQGALAVEVRADSPDVADLVARLHHAPTASAVTGERAVLAALGGGCLLPVSALGLVEEGELILESRVISPDGRLRVTGRARGPAADASGLAAEVARILTDQGALDLLGAAR